MWVRVFILPFTWFTCRSRRGRLAIAGSVRSPVFSQILHTIKVCWETGRVPHGHSCWSVSHGSLISDVMPNLCWKECLLVPLVFEWFFFKRKQFERFQVLNAVVLRNIFDKTLENKRMNGSIIWPFFKNYLFWGRFYLRKRIKADACVDIFLY